MSKIKYKRILLKLSGEALQGEEGFGIDPSILSSICDEIKAAHTLGVEVAIVVGGGNFLRGADLIQYNFNKVASDQIGMLATTMNAIAIEDMLSSKGVKVKHLSPFNIKPICDTYNFREANNLLESTVLVFSGGTSNPFCTTDSAACLRGVECNVDIVLKGTKVDGIYTKDPVKFADAVKYDELTFDEAVDKKLKVMDLSAFILAQEHNLPICVFDLKKEGVLTSIALGNKEGTLVK